MLDDRLLTDAMRCPSCAHELPDGADNCPTCGLSMYAPQLAKVWQKSREIAELTARLRRLRALSAAGRYADPAERAALLADKHALIARIEAANRRVDTADDARTDTGERPADEQSGADQDADDDGEEWSR